MFNKKKAVLPINYNDWEKDFGFLNYMLQIKQQLIWSATIDIVLSKPIANSDRAPQVTEAEAMDATEKIVESVTAALSDTYKIFIINKYFKDENAFLTYLVETVYYDTITYSLDKNRKSTKAHNLESLERIKAKQQLAKKKEAIKPTTSTRNR